MDDKARAEGINGTGMADGAAAATCCRTPVLILSEAPLLSHDLDDALRLRAKRKLAARYADPARDGELREHQRRPEDLSVGGSCEATQAVAARINNRCMPNSDQPIPLENSHTGDHRNCADAHTIKALAFACLDDGGHGLAVFDATDQLRYGNATFLQTFAVTALTQTWASILRHSAQRKDGLPVETDDPVASTGNEKKPRRCPPVRTFAADLADGRCLWVTETIQPDGRLTVLTIDITTLKSNERALRSARDEALLAANTDALTGAFNRRFMYARLDEALSGLNAVARPFSVCMFDLDHFKEVNDTYGHFCGDQVIQHFVRAAQHHLRPSDWLGRIGGEEFLLVLPDTGIDGARQVVERLRHLVSESAPALSVPGFRYTFSAGVTEGRPGDIPDDILHRTDRALYIAKRAGRDRYAVVTCDTRLSCEAA